MGFGVVGVICGTLGLLLRWLLFGCWFVVLDLVEAFWADVDVCVFALEGVDCWVFGGAEVAGSCFCGGCCLDFESVGLVFVGWVLVFSFCHVSVRGFVVGVIGVWGGRFGSRICGLWLRFLCHIWLLVWSMFRRWGLFVRFGASLGLLRLGCSGLRLCGFGLLVLVCVVCGRVGLVVSVVFFCSLVFLVGSDVWALNIVFLWGLISYSISGKNLVWVALRSTKLSEILPQFKHLNFMTSWPRGSSRISRNSVLDGSSSP